MYRTIDDMLAAAVRFASHDLERYPDVCVEDAASEAAWNAAGAGYGSNSLSSIQFQLEERGVEIDARDDVVKVLRAWLYAEALPQLA